MFFYLKAFKARVDILSNDWNKLEQLKQELIDYYCEDPLTFNFDEFFKIFADLCRNITKARDVNYNIENNFNN